jgi:hypothetical protein
MPGGLLSAAFNGAVVLGYEALSIGLRSAKMICIRVFQRSIYNRKAVLHVRNPSNLKVTGWHSNELS